jgi:L-ascorbate metabolism protein UlaG (beta-lactamase superfamily)
MKRIIVSLFIATLSGFAVQAQIVKSYEKPAEKEFKAAVKQVLKNTSCMAEDTVARLEALNVIQREFNNFPAEDWKNFVFNNWNWIEIDDMEHHGALYFYRQAFNKVRKEVRSTKVAEGTVVLWNVYNMGYIVKTPTHTFGIDVVHKHIEEIAKELDFMLITHKHNDHGDGHTRNQMAFAGVKAIAGFELAKPCVWQGKLLAWEYVDLIDSIQIGDITINCRRVDHNKEEWGKNFVTTYEINCGPASGNTVIYHTGDAHNYRQLEVSHKPDIFIFHMGVGLNIQKALDKIQPEYAIFSHAWEMAHKVDKFRWTIDDVLKSVHKVTGHDSSRLLYPCWGDKIVYNKK